MEEEWNIFMEYGNRTSSFMSMYPGLENIKIENGQARGITTRNSIVLATEPHCNEESRADEILMLKNSQKKKICLFPIGEKLTEVLEKHDFSAWQIGSEPIFNLDDYFKTNPLDFLPLGRTLKKRGATLQEVRPSELELIKDKLIQIHEQWKNQKTFELGFLNQVDPFFKFELKRCFTLTIRNEIQAFMTAVPFYYGGEILGYYFNDIIRTDKARAGTNELLIVEAMRTLYDEGVSEVRMGMAPLSRIKKKGISSSFLNFIFKHYTFGYNFSGHYQFKNKLRPTRWDDLYLASSESDFIQSLKKAIEAHFPKGLWHLAQSIVAREWGKFLNIKPDIKNMIRIKKGEDLFFTSIRTYLRKTRWTHCLMFFFIILHILKINHPFFANLFTQSAYTPAHLTLGGLLLAPLFHNDLFHIFGDQLSFYIFGVFVEIILGVRFFLLLTMAGLFLSNPLTHLIVAPILSFFPDLMQNHFLLEKDYGSSNAVFTLVGGMGGIISSKSWLFIPFLVYAVLIAFSLESFLSIHHIIALYLGYFMVNAGSVLYAHNKKAP